MNNLRLALALATGCLLVASCSRGGSDETQFTILGGKLPTGKTIRCAIDRINSKPAGSKLVTVESGRPVRILGWVSGPGKQAPGEFDMLLVGKETYAAPASAGLKRADVARSLKSEALANSGFNVAFDLSKVKGGTYQVKISQKYEGQSYFCHSRTRLVVLAR